MAGKPSKWSSGVTINSMEEDEEWNRMAMDRETMLRLYKESVKLDRTLVVDEEYSITIEGYW